MAVVLGSWEHTASGPWDHRGATCPPSEVVKATHPLTFATALVFHHPVVLLAIRKTSTPTPSVAIYPPPYPTRIQYTSTNVKSIPVYSKI